MEADDDPEKRIRELERELADIQRTPYEAPPQYSGNVTRWGALQYQPTPIPRSGGGIFPAYRIVMLVVMAVSIGAGVVSIAAVLFRANNPSTAPKSSGPMSVAPGGSMTLTGNSETATVACNGGNLALDGFHGTYTV